MWVHRRVVASFTADTVQHLAQVICRVNYTCVWPDVTLARLLHQQPLEGRQSANQALGPRTAYLAALEAQAHRDTTRNSLLTPGSACAQEGEGVGAGQLARDTRARAHAAQGRHAAGPGALRRLHPVPADALPDRQLQPGVPQAPSGPLGPAVADLTLLRVCACALILPHNGCFRWELVSGIQGIHSSALSILGKAGEPSILTVMEPANA